MKTSPAHKEPQQNQSELLIKLKAEQKRYKCTAKLLESQNERMEKLELYCRDLQTLLSTKNDEINYIKSKYDQLYRSTNHLQPTSQNIQFKNLNEQLKNEKLYRDQMSEQIYNL